jgi:glycerophosphoryl diester phosphodiesterase
LIFAHRGASLHAPENTMESFELAVRLGAQVLEMDVHRTADGEVVVLHDASVDRTTNGTGPIAEMTWSAAQQWDAGATFLASSGSRPFAGRQCRIPRLSDVMAAFPKVGFNIEVKVRDPKLVAQTVAIVAASGNVNVVLAAEDPGTMALLEAAQPTCALGLDTNQAKRTIMGAWFGVVPQRFAYRALQMPVTHYGFTLLGRLSLRRLRAAKVLTHFFVINDVPTAQRWLALGADGIMSDDPGALLQGDLNALP